MSRASATSAGSTLDQGHGKIINAARDREPGRADAGAKLDQALARLRRTRRGQQDGVVADAMAFARLAQNEPAAEHGVLADIRLLSGHHG